MNKKALFPFDRYLKYKKDCEQQGREINWRFVCHYFQLPEDFIEEHIDEVDWNYVTANQNLSTDFIARHADKIVWNFISNKYDTLTEDFVREFVDYIRWDLQDMMKFSLDFRREFWKKLYE